MTKRVWVDILIGIWCLIAFGTLAWSTWYFISQNDTAYEQYAVLGDGFHTVTASDLEEIYPGAEVKYNLKLIAKQKDEYHMTLRFHKTDASPLGEFVRVELRVNGEPLDSDMLANYLSGKEIVFTADLTQERMMELEIVYSMGAEIGDEAQNAEANFDIVISSER